MVRPIDDEYLPRRDVFCIDVKSFFASVEAVRRRIHPLHAYVIVIARKERLVPLCWLPHHGSKKNSV